MVDEIGIKIQLFKKKIMKIKLNKWVGLMTGFLILLVSLNSCIKDRNVLGTDFSHLQDHVTLVNGGLVNFGAANVRFNSDTTTLNITANLASVNLPTSPVNVTIGVDSAQIATYNAAKGTNFLPFPNDGYKIKATSLTIVAGQQTATTTVEIYKEKFDPTLSYMLPISIKDASGKTLSSNLNTIFFNIIGNVIAGTYNWDFKRWNNLTGTGTLAGQSFTGHSTAFIADDPQTVEVATGYFTQPRYVISFTDSSGVLINFKVTFNPDDITYMKNNGVNVADGPNIIKADPVTGEYIFQWKADVGRYLIDRFYK